MRGRAQRSRRRRAALGGLVLAGLAVAAILISGGSAATTSKPYTANVCDAGQLGLDVYGQAVCPAPSAPPTLAGGTATTYLTLHNEAGSQSLGSANVGLPAGPAHTAYTAAQIVSPGAGTVTSSSTLVTLRNLDLAPNHSLTVKLTMSTPVCVGGTYDWSGKNGSGAPLIQVKQSNNFNGPPGNDFTRVAPSSLTATLSGGGCHLAVVTGHQPTDTVKNQPITDAPESSGGPVQVGLYDAADNLVDLGGSCPSGPGCVSAAFSGGDSGATLGGTKAQPLVHGIASFGNLTLDRSSSTLYRLAFTSSDAGVTGTSSDEFAIGDAGKTCSAGETCSLPGTFTGTQSSSTTTTNVTTTFATAGSLSLTFFTSGLPSAVTGPGGGCENFVPTSSAGVALRITGSTGAAVIDYGLSDKALKKRYGPNYGQPNVPICVGAQRVDGGGNRIPCETDAGGPWTGKALGTDGRLNGHFKAAVCDPGTHLWWSIAPTFQDDPAPAGFAPISIVISSWGSSSASDVSGLRNFTITKPNPWDYQMRG